MKRIICFITFFTIFSVYAKTNSTISGTVSDEKKTAIPFANVILMNSTDSSLVKSALTDESGKYSFNEIAPGNYLILAAQLGFGKVYTQPIEVKTEANEIAVNEISLPSTTINLREAQVTALRPFIEHRIDRTVVNVENSIVNAGSTAIEILQRSPGVTVDNDGNITLTGKQGVLVMIDGKPTYLSQKDLFELLRNTSSDQVAYIEIITNPSAKYDAAGTSGIINIKMRKKQSRGFNGRANASYGQGVYPDFGGGLSLNYGNEKLNLFSGYDYMNGFYFERITLNREFKDNGSVSIFRQHTFDKGNYKNHNFRGGADYSINKKHSIGFIAKGNFNYNVDNTTSTTDIFNQQSYSDSGYVTSNHNDSKWTNYSGNVNYRFQIDTTGRELTADADYAHYSNSSDFAFVTNHYFTGNDYTYQEVATSDQPAEINIRSIKLDYTHPFSNKMKLELGGKSSYVNTDNDVRYYNYDRTVRILDTGKTNHFKYTEKINAIYSNWSGEFGKTGIQLGLRAEQTIADGVQLSNNSAFTRDYIQFFPSAFVSYKISDNHQTNISYSRRIDRPAYQQLNPFKYYIDPYNYMEGNPLLEPQLTNSFELSYTFKQQYSLSVNYSHTEDAMTQITKQIDSTRTTFVTTENLDSYDNYGINLSIPISIGDRFNSSNNFNLFQNKYAGQSSIGYVEKDLMSYTFNSNNRITLFKGISAEINFWYNSRMVWGTWLVKPHYSLSGGFSKMFLNEKIQLRINLNDLLHTDIIDSKIQYQNINADFRRVYDSQFVRFHVSYKFGTQEQKRMRRAGATEEERRVQQGR